MSKHAILLLVLIFSSGLRAQKPGEAGIISDNDLWTSPVSDHYYTNGVEIFYRYLGTRQTEKLAKNILYLKKVFPNRFKEKIDFQIQGELNVGTIWMGATIGPVARISLKGPLQPMYNSALHGAALNKDPAAYSSQKELFLYLNPNINYQRYDATIQGSMFNDESPITFPLLPFRFNAEAGIKYRNNHWNYSYSFNYRGKELTNNVIEGYFYGSIVVSYFFYK